MVIDLPIINKSKEKVTLKSWIRRQLFTGMKVVKSDKEI
jgi:hypothetical protein